MRVGVCGYFRIHCTQLLDNYVARLKATLQEHRCIMNSAIKKKLALGVCTVTIVLCILCICYLLLHISRNHVNKQDAFMCSVNVEDSSLACDEQSTCKCPDSDGRCNGIKVDVRAVGAEVKLEGCESSAHYCADTQSFQYGCITGECATLEGLFNCSSSYGTKSSVCWNVTDVLECSVQNTGDSVVCNSKRACLQLTGLYDCKFGECSRVAPPFNCKRKCEGLGIENNNVIVIENRATVHTGKCARAVKFDGKAWAEVWKHTPEKPNRTLVVKCTTQESNDTYSDCYDGLVVDQPQVTNLSDLLGLFGSTHFDQHVQAILEAPRLQEGCVECDEIMRESVHDDFRCFASDDTYVRKLKVRSFVARLVPFGLIVLLSVLCCFTVAVRKRILSDKATWFRVCCFERKSSESQL